MYKVLIVDDEATICRGLRIVIDWNRYGFEVSDYALNGLDALEKAARGKFDVIITDVRMPKVDGLELIRRLKEIDYPAKIIILSGYKDFEYAQAAVEFGVKKYILKPVNPEILVKAIEEVRFEIEEGRKQETAIKESISIIREKLISNLLKNETDERAIRKRANEVGINIDDRLFQVCLAEVYNVETDKKAAFNPVLRKIIEDAVYSSSLGYVIELENEKLCVLVCTDRNGAVPVRSVLAGICERIREYAGYNIHFAAGNEVTEYNRINESFRNASGVLECKLFGPECCILFFDEINTNRTIEAVIKYTREHCHERLSLRSISREFFISPVYLGRLFKSYTGMGYADFVINCKMELAAKLLDNTELMVYEVADKVGYTDYNHFCRVFKSKKGVTPSEFRHQKV